MKRADEGGLLSVAAAVAAAIAGAVARFLLERRSRSQSNKGELEMCRNHSHVKGRIFSMTEDDSVTEVRMLLVQPLTVESTSGARLTLPQYCVCSVRVPQRGQSVVSQLHEMAVQENGALPREELISSSGPIVQPK